MKSICLLFFVVGLSVRLFGLQEDPNRFIRPSEAQSPEAERAGFHVPEGFEVQLFADDAQLGGKPINMAFDTRGRLWVTCTQEYPFAVKKEKWSADTASAPGSKDSIRILEDTDGDGRADKVTVFATDLNIPTGVLPYKNGCIAWSIPNILYLEDTDGDGHADKRTILFGPLGFEKDTHGMISSFRLGLDGWVYATHGFSNTSHFTVRPENKKPDTESKPFDVSSGSVFRFKPDGSQVELWTSGQVNPFGLCWDSWGNLYSADCHSSPIYQLIRGACYPSFGRPHDGLGFGPVMCEHAHGSTGICGPVYIDGGIWGTAWDDHMFVCNPVTSKINHDHITFTGSTPKANEQPDFLTSDDLWFHPVDLQLGPDSALYIADFYNRIIGHYEVPLDHPGRDRKSGRIWRVVKKGSTGRLKGVDLKTATVERILTELSSSNLVHRMLVTNELEARGEEAWPAIQSVLSGPTTSASAKTHCLWAAYRLRKIGASMLERLRDDSSSVLIQQQLLRLLSADDHVPGLPNPYQFFQFLLAAPPPPAGFSTVPLGRNDPWQGDPFYVRAKAEALGLSKDPAAMLSTLRIFDDLAPGDSAGQHTARIALRNLLSLKNSFQPIPPDELPPGVRVEVARIALAITTQESATWLLTFLQNEKAEVGKIDRALVTQALTHIAHHLPASHQSELVNLVEKHFGDDLDTQLDLFHAIQQGNAERQSSSKESETNAVVAGDPMRRWADKLATRLTEFLQTKGTDEWQPIAIGASASPWFRQTRKCTDGAERAFLCSLPPGGEKLTGTLRSKDFGLPKTLKFWIAGHRGSPRNEAHEKNFIRLVDAQSGAEIAKAYPPRNDVAQSVTWDLNAAAPKRGRLEITDGDDGGAYAWLAVGGFAPEVVGLPEMGAPAQDKRIRAAAELAATWKTQENPGATVKRAHTPAYPDLAKRLNALPNREAYSPDTRVALARLCFWVPLFMPDEVPQLARDPDLVKTVFNILEDDNEHTALAAAFKTLPSRSQIKLASALASAPETGKQILDLAAPAVLADPLVSGKLNALNDATISERLRKATASLPAQNDALNKLIAERLKSFDPAKANAARGQDVFMRTCSVCHRIGVKGNLVGPQLDGIGPRGAERLMEDILDPNRSVDPAFRLHIVKLKTGGLVTGLLRREQDGELIFADAAGQEQRVKKEDVSEDSVSPFSLMPSGFGEALKTEELHDLLAFLLARKA